METDFRNYLEEKYQQAQHVDVGPDVTFLEKPWEPFRHTEHTEAGEAPDTGVDAAHLRLLGERITHLPSGPNFFTKIQKIFEEHRKLVAEGTRLDWAMGELLAYATLVDEGHPVRVSGQDTERGTFSHRHAVVTVEDSEEEYVPLAHVRPGQAPFQIYNSPLSEYGVLGFEYGYAMAVPDGLTVWEAQYGDFANGAQSMIDQFIVSGETKWQQMNGLVLLLPHGYEGQGPEHSSARIERFLSLCADHNLSVVNCTTPANFFHALRRQLYRPYREPLVVATPKSLLRHPKAVSALADFAPGTRFQAVMDDAAADPQKVRRVILCSGRLYYDLLERRDKEQRADTALIRLEQLYPVPEKQIAALRQKYVQATRWLYVQEEPANMGGWPYLRNHLPLPGLEGVSRAEASTTATGFPAQHAREQEEILQRAFESLSS